MDKATKIIIAIAVFMVGIQYLVSIDNSSEPVYHTIQVIEDRPSFKVSEEEYELNDYSPVVKLKIKPTLNYPAGTICSGVVISNAYVLTAAHCLIEKGSNMRTTIIIESSGLGRLSNEISNQVATVVGINKRTDYGLVKGDFSKFQKAPIDTNPQLTLNQHQLLSMCGFPWGEEHYICNFTQIKRMCADGKVCVDGVIHPGMSGGPVTSLSGLVVIGVNHAVLTIEPGAMFSPLVGLFSSLGIKVE